MGEGGIADAKPDRFRIYAEALASLIDDPATDTPLTIAIHAPWGTGKSFLARRLFHLLQEKPAAAGRYPHVGCWFNAWMHDDADNIATALVSHIAQTADRMRPWWRRFRSPLPVSFAPPGERTQRRLVLILATVLLGILASRVLLAVFELGTVVQYVAKEILGWEVSSEASRAARVDLKAHGGGWLVVFSTLALAVARRFAEIGSGLGGFLKNPEAAASSGSIDRVRQQLGVIVRQATPPGSRFVVFIDEVDLCRPPHCIDLLETVSQLLDQPCIVSVVIADVSAIAAHAEIKYEKLAARYLPGTGYRARAGEGPAGYGRVYLEKFLHMEFSLPLACDPGVIESAVCRRKHGPAEIAPARAKWVSLVRETLHPVTRPTELARHLHRDLPDAEQTRESAGHASGHSLMSRSESFFGPLARLWDLPPGLWMLLAGGVFVLLLPARTLVLAAARAAYPTEVRPFAVCIDRVWEKRCASVLMLVWLAAAWWVVALRALGVSQVAFGPASVAAAGLVLWGWLVVALRRIDARDRRALIAIRRSLSNHDASGDSVPAARPGVLDLLRSERQRLDAATTSDALAEATAEALRHLPASPRRAKRAALLVRVEVDVLQMLGLVGGNAPLTPRHIGKWVALRERWPMLGALAAADARQIGLLEAAAAADDPGALASLLPEGLVDDAELRLFLTSAPALSDTAGVLVRLSYPPPADRSSGPREKVAVAKGVTSTITTA
jgi:hypothetical protein